MATQSALQRARRAAQRAKKQLCLGKTTKTKVKQAGTRYKKELMKRGNSSTEAQRKVNRIINGGCSVSTRVSGTKRKRKTTKRKTARRRTR